MTTKTLRIGAATLPLLAIHDVIAIVGRRGRGKTVAAKNLVEQAFAAGGRFCVVDPTGAWWGLTSSASGEEPGIPCVVFGGNHAMVPLEPTAGEIMGDFAADPTQPSLVLDVSTFTRGEQIRFLTAFMARVYQKNTASLLLVLDEADQVAPQSKDEKAENLLLGATQRIVKLGRVKGFGVLLVTQRPASLHKNVLTQASVLITLGLTGPQDHKAVLEWIRYQADEGKAQEVLSSLPGLERGEAWVWAPEQGLLKRVQVPLPRTFDSSQSPAGMPMAEPRAVAEVDLDKLTEAIRATVERAKENDPRALRARIAELERAQDSRVVGCLCNCHDGNFPNLPPHPDCVACQRLLIEEAEFIARREAEEVAYGGQALVDALRDREERMLGHLDLVHQAIRRDRQRVRDLVHELSIALDALDDDGYAGLAEVIDKARETAGRETEGAISRPAPRSARPVPSSGGDRPAATRLQVARPVPMSAARPAGGPEARILSALAELHQMGIAVPERVQAAFFAGYTNARSKGFTNALGALRSRGLVLYSGSGLSLSPEGQRVAEAPPRRRTSAELQAYLFGQLGAVPTRILEPLIRAYPRAIDREELGRLAGYGNARSKGFTNVLGRLRTFGFVTYGGQAVRATDLLFVR
jgi:uncharacterized protein